nr:sigma 54-interacting transcriptional regulator [uncultured Desulfobacter sp.]
MQIHEHEMDAFWEKIVNTINDGLMFIGPDGTIQMVNKAFETLTGYTSAQAVGMSCRMLECDACEQTLTPLDKSVWCRLFAPREAEMKKCRCLIKRRDGSYLPVLKNAAAFRDEHQNVVGVVETLTDISELERLDKQVNMLARQRSHDNDFFGMTGKSQQMETVFDMIRKASDSNAPVIILGESGSGKELVADAIHLNGARKQKPFIRLNCAALNPAVLESEMFGHVKGAFTGAHSNRVGRFEAAHQGSFFLDEIGDMPLPLQTKLLRVLESGQFERVGEITPVRVDVRIITATNKNLEALIEKNEFRQDLFFRINVIPIYLPPLRQRTEDIPLLVNTFIRQCNQSTGKTISGVSRDVMDLFMSYQWPGNIRELKNAMDYAFVTADGPTIQLNHIPKRIGADAAISTRPANTERPDDTTDEKQKLIDALIKANGNQTYAAKLLDINRVTVWNRMKKYQIDLQKTLTSK